MENRNLTSSLLLAIGAGSGAGLGTGAAVTTDGAIVVVFGDGSNAPVSTFLRRMIFVVSFAPSPLGFALSFSFSGASFVSGFVEDVMVVLLIESCGLLGGSSGTDSGMGLTRRFRSTFSGSGSLTGLGITFTAGGSSSLKRVVF